MPVQYYIIPPTAPPYSEAAPQEPQYVSEIRCNHIPYYLPSFNQFLVMVNTTPAKHADLAGRAGVRQLPAGITVDTVISTLSNPAQNVISNFCTQIGIPFDVTETIGGLLNRIILSDICTFGGTSTTTQYNALTAEQQNRLSNLFLRSNSKTPGANETIKGLSERIKNKLFSERVLIVGEF